MYMTFFFFFYLILRDICEIIMYNYYNLHDLL